MSWFDYDDDDIYDPELDYEEEPPRHRCGEGNSVAKYSTKNNSYFIGCYHYPKCKYTRESFYPEDEIKISRLKAIRAMTGRRSK